MKHAYLGLSIGFAMLFALAMVVFQSAFAEAEWELVEPDEPANFYIMMPEKDDNMGSDHVAEAADTTSNWGGHDMPVEEENHVKSPPGPDAIMAFAQPDNPINGITP